MNIPSMRDVEAADLQAFGQLLPEGEYVVTITDAEEKTSTKGTPYVEITFSVVSPVQYRGRQVRDRVYFSAAALPIAKAKFDAISYDTSTDRVFNPGDMVNRGCVIKVEHESGFNKENLPRTFANVTLWKKSGATGTAAPSSSGPAADDDIPF